MGETLEIIKEDVKNIKEAIGRGGEERGKRLLFNCYFSDLTAVDRSYYYITNSQITNVQGAYNHHEYTLMGKFFPLFILLVF